MKNEHRLTDLVQTSLHIKFYSNFKPRRGFRNLIIELCECMALHAKIFYFVF